MLIPTVGVGVLFGSGLGLDGLEGLDVGLGGTVAVLVVSAYAQRSTP